MEDETKLEIDKLMEVSSYLIPKTVQMIKQLKEELLKNGFTKEETLAIITNYKLIGK